MTKTANQASLALIVARLLPSTAMLRAAALAPLLAICSAAPALAEIQFVGVMSNSTQTVFALRAREGTSSRWLSVGEQCDGFVITAYDARSEALTLRKGTTNLVLRLPEAHVRMALDEVVAGLQRILGVRGATQMRDLLHPKLRPLFKEEDLASKQLAILLAPGAKVEILPLTPEEKQSLDQGLSELEKVLEVRPAHGLWIRTPQHGSMVFVVRSGDSWFLTPSVPGTTTPQ